jgi:hypothetical protein
MTRDAYRQADAEGFQEALEEIGLIDMPAHEFERRFGIAFTPNDGRRDAPGPMAYAAVELASGQRFLLEHHFDYREPGVWLLGRVSEDLEGQRDEFARALNLPPGCYRFIRSAHGWIDPHSGEPA